MAGGGTPPSVVGQAPTPEDQYWTEAASALTPEKSLERIDAHGKYLFGIVSVTTVLLTSLGTIGVADLAPRARSFLLAPVGLVCLSLGLAMAGVTPNLDKVNRSNLLDVRRYYNELVQRRGRFVFWAGMAFAAGLLAIPLALAIAQLPAQVPPPVGLSLVLKVAHEGTGPVASLRVEYQGLPSGASVETRLIGRKQGAEQFFVLFSETSRSTQTETLVVEGQTDAIDEYRRLELESTARGTSGVVASDRAVLTR